MKYFSLKGVKDAYKQISTTTKDKFWGILGILYSIDCTIEPCKTYNINTPKLADFLEGIFRLSNKKTYETSNSVYSVVFANSWEDKVAEHFLVGKPDIMPIIVWAYRNTRFETELNANELFERFVCDFHISNESIRSLFSIRLENYQLEYGDAKYRDDDLLRELRGSISTDATTIKMNNQFVVANAGDLSRGPFFQPLYASLNTLECLIIFPFDTTDYYNVFKSNKVNHTSCTNVDTGQIIYYGCPGSGKSHKVKKDTEGVNTDFVFRTTFHPDTDYASFVGCYKPISTRPIESLLTEEQLVLEYNKIVFEANKKTQQRIEFISKYANSFINIAEKQGSFNIVGKVVDDEPLGTYYAEFVKQIATERANGNVGISYKFSPQVFTNAYVQAWNNPDEKVYLIIEEINRGNCAQIFGDLFQLLDRDKSTGVSEYPVKADKDLADHLKEVLGADHEGIKGGELKLPSNLIIYATMNTSDQSLFPMDSAFKRRWDWEYVPIEYGADKESYDYIITIDNEHKYRWVDFLKIVNEKIYDTTRSEDKQMGNFFIKKSVDAQEFINKVMFYLWNEVCKEEYGNPRNFFRVAEEGNKDGKEFKFVDLFDKAKTNDLLIGFMNHLKVGEYTE